MHRTKSFAKKPPATACAALLLLAASVDSPAQGTLVIRFEEPPAPPPGTGSTSVQNYYESGVWFRPLNPGQPLSGFARLGGGASSFPDNGTPYVEAFPGNSLAFSFTNGMAFNLVAADLGEYNTTFSPGPVTVPLVAYRRDGTAVTNTVVTDGIIDGTGPLADFQTFTFDDRFQNLDRVEIPTWGWSLDNLVLVPIIPEPAPAALLLLGTGAIALCSRALRRPPAPGVP